MKPSLQYILPNRARPARVLSDKRSRLSWREISQDFRLVVFTVGAQCPHRRGIVSAATLEKGIFTPTPSSHIWKFQFYDGFVRSGADRAANDAALEWSSTFSAKTLSEMSPSVPMEGVSHDFGETRTTASPGELAICARTPQSG